MAQAKTQKQMELLERNEPVDNPEVRQALIDQIRTMERLKQAQRDFGAAKRKSKEILTAWGDGLKDGESMDLIVGEAYIIRLVARQRDERAPSKPGLTVTAKYRPQE